MKIAANVGINLIHSRVRAPQGKGKIERFFSTLREQFLTRYEEEGHSGIKEINERLHLWIEEEYHQTPHRGIDNQTPLDKWCQAADKLRIAGPLDEIDDKFLFEAERKVATDSTVSLHTRTCEVASVLVGKTVTLRYDPTAPQRPIKVT